MVPSLPTEAKLSKEPKRLPSQGHNEEPQFLFSDGVVSGKAKQEPIFYSHPAVTKSPQPFPWGDVTGGLVEHQGSHHYSAVRGHLHGLVSKDHAGSQNVRSCPVMTRINLLLGCQWRLSEEPGLLPPLSSNKLLFSFVGAVSLQKQSKRGFK